jgi:hypothetical protein
VKLEALKTVLSVSSDLGKLPELPFSRREMAIAKLLSRCPGIPQVIAGELSEWSKSDEAVTAAAEYARENAKSFAAFSRHSQRILGLQFTDRTPDIRCFHKLLSMVGLSAIAFKRIGGGRGHRHRLYRLESVEDIASKIQAREQEGKPISLDLLRQQYRAESVKATLAQLSSHAANRLEAASKELRRFEAEIFLLGPQLQRENFNIPEAVDLASIPEELIDDLADLLQLAGEDEEAIAALRPLYDPLIWEEAWQRATA